MKRIYAFTLDGEDYPSSRFRYDLRLIAFLMYDKIYNYDGEGATALIINNKIRNNDIYEGYRNYEYYLMYDEYNEKYINYEPVLLNENSFALTIDDEIMSEEIIKDLMNEVLLQVFFLSKIRYNYTIKTISYLSRNIDDEKNRKKAFLQLRDILNGKIENKTGLVKKKMMTSSLFGRKVGLF